MTPMEPKAKRMFNRTALSDIIGHTSKPTLSAELENFIDSEIARNRKEAVREFAEKVRHGVVIDQVRMNDKCRECQFEIWDEWDKKIDAELAKLDAGG